MIRYPRKGFTLVEIIIVVAIIATVIAIVIPNYLTVVNASRRNTCITNLRQIDSAVEQWALANGIASGTVLSPQQENEVYGYLKADKPKCPSSGIYTISPMDEIPQVKCSLEDEGHTLENNGASE